MEKKIKINFVDFYSGFDKYNNEFVDVLKERYVVEISDKPDYIFYSCFGTDHLKYDCIRIFFTGECYTPDFNECDYAIGFDRLEFGDRYVRIPLYNLFQYKPLYRSLINREPITKQELDSKSGFCSFVYSNCFAQDKRTIFYKLLSEYKKVNSGGRYMNNVGGPVPDKREFQNKHKFAIAFENTSHAGYSTEKIVDAFAARTIPIYYGDPEIAKDFNPESFINVHDFDSLEAVVEQVKEIDNDDDKYLAMINSPIVANEQDIDGLKKFLYYIFDQELEKTHRRSKSIPARSLEAFKRRHRFFENHIYRNYKKVRNQLYRMTHNTSLKRR